MWTPIGLVSLFIVVFVVALLAQLPLAWVLGQAGLDRAGISHGRVTGTVWSGQVSGLQVMGQPIGRVSLDHQPGALLSGRVAYRLTFRGETGEGRGEVAVGLDRTVRVQDLVADIDVQSLRRLQPQLRQVPSDLQVTLSDLVIGADRRCRSATGQLRTDVLEAIGPRLDWAGPVLQGPLRCEAGALGLTLAGGAPGEDRIEVEGQVALDTQIYRVEARVETGAPRVAETVRALGFAGADGTYAYRKTNAPQAGADLGGQK